MSEYRRFVAYIYEYTNGKKNKNTGFAKVESRNGVCRMQIHLQKIPREEKALNIYGFVREGGWLPGILLGKIFAQGSCGEARIQTPAGNIGGSGYALSQLAGIWVESGQGRTYLTVFDDEGIDTAKLVKELPETVQKEAAEAKSRAAEEEGESRTERAEAAGNRTEEAEGAKIHEGSEAAGNRAEEATETKIPEEAEETKSRAEEAEAAGNRAEEATETKIPEEAEETESRAAEGKETECHAAEEEGDQTKESGEEEGTEKKGPAAAGVHKEETAEEDSREEPENTAEEDSREEPENTVAEDSREEPGNTAEQDGRSGLGMERSENPETAGEQKDPEKEGTAGRAEKKGSEQLHAQETAACPAPGCPYRNRQAQPSGLDQKWKMLSGRCPHFRPFADEELADCIQITPRELHVIRQGNCRMGNNSFLMHGFCNYRHLLFGRLRNGGYLLGIPGIFENQELFMANMFGFPEFKEAASRHPQGRFGYWCRRL